MNFCGVLGGCLVITTRCVCEDTSEPTLCVLLGFIAVDDVQPLRVQPLDQGERHQRVGHRSPRAFVKFIVQVGHFGIEAVGNRIVCGYGNREEGKDLVCFTCST